MVVLEVRKENVPVPREMVELSDVAPTKWSVVEWSKGQLGVRRASESNMGMSYAVCPACRERRAVEPANAQSMVCPGCGATFEVDWENPC